MIALLLKYRFTKEVGVDMLDLLVSTGPIKYSRIVELDQRVREFSPKDIIWSNDAEPHGATVLDMVKRHMISAHKDASMSINHNEHSYVLTISRSSHLAASKFLLPCIGRESFGPTSNGVCSVIYINFSKCFRYAKNATQTFS